MSTQSKIEWTEQTWNPTVGCTKISPGCKNCYAETMARRLQAIGVRGYENGFQLTLMPERLAEPLERRKPTVYFVNSMSMFCGGIQVPPNAWLGVSVENRKYGVPRIDALRTIDASVRFLSIEPLLEHLGRIDLTGIHWVIVGGESGVKARPMKPEWVDGIKRQCDAVGAAFFFKQWGSWGADGQKRSKGANGRRYQGREWDNMPDLLAEVI